MGEGFIALGDERHTIDNDVEDIYKNEIIKNGIFIDIQTLNNVSYIDGYYTNSSINPIKLITNTHELYVEISNFYGILYQKEIVKAFNEINETLKISDEMNRGKDVILYDHLWLYKHYLNDYLIGNNKND